MPKTIFLSGICGVIILTETPLIAAFSKVVHKSLSIIKYGVVILTDFVALSTIDWIILLPTLLKYNGFGPSPKGIKKLLLSIGIISSTIFGLFANCTPVKAESYLGQSILESEFISNIYIKKIKTNGTGKYEQARFLRRSEDNAFVYCMQPFVSIDNNYVYNVARSDYELYLNMSKEQFRKMYSE